MTIEKFKELSKELELVEEDIRRVESILQNEPFDNISLSYTGNRINYILGGAITINLPNHYLKSYLVDLKINKSDIIKEIEQYVVGGIKWKK